MECKCIICGKIFDAVHKTSVCSDSCKIKKCVICGNEFKLTPPYTQQTCSAKCRGQYRKISGIAKQASDKAHSHSAKVSKPTHTKICPLCNNEFLPDTFRQVYCKADHFRPCPICGKPVKVTSASEAPKTCSTACRVKKTNLTCLDKYGNKDAVNSAHGRMKARATMQSKYGVSHYSMTAEYREKYKATSQERYGTDHPMQNTEVLSDVQRTNQDRYGGASPMCSEEVRRKAADSAKAHYGGIGLSSDILRPRIQATNLERYGCANPMQNKTVQDKVAETCMSRYGATSYGASLKHIEHIMVDPSKVLEFASFRDDPEAYISAHFQDAPTVSQLCSMVGVTDTPVYNILIEHNCKHLVDYKTSSMELEVIDFLTQLGVSNIIRNTRKIIPPYEIDIYLPEFKYGVECNPTVTHNSSFSDPWGSDRIAPSYHKHKSELAADRGTRLFHIFGYDWSYRKEIIKSMIASQLGFIAESIYARTTKVVEVSDIECRKFLSENHQKGSGSFPVRLGLIATDGTLVSLMTFNRMRKTIGIQDSSYELSRFCNQLNTRVVGGASKLFTYFIRNYNPISVVSYSDIAHTSGHLYPSLGFIEEARSGPNYVWVNLNTDQSINRLNVQKSRIAQFLHDPNIDLSMSEKQIMESHGYAQVFDSGTIRWRWSNR